MGTSFARQQQGEQAMAGWMLSLSILWALYRHPTVVIDARFWAVLITCCRVLLSWAVLKSCQFSVRTLSTAPVEVHTDVRIFFLKKYSCFCAVFVRVDMCDDCDRFPLMLIFRKLKLFTHSLHHHSIDVDRRFLDLLSSKVNSQFFGFVDIT